MFQKKEELYHRKLNQKTWFSNRNHFLTIKALLNRNKLGNKINQ